MNYIIKKNNNELEKNYIIRKKYIESLNPKNKKELLLYVNYSNILINILYLGNKYNKETMKKFKKTLKNIKNINIIKNIKNINLIE